MKDSKQIIGILVTTGLTSTLFLTGCSSTTPIGKVGDVEFFQ